MNLSRRGFLRASGLIIAAPAIIRVAKLMPISQPKLIVIDPLQRIITLFVESDDILSEMEFLAAPVFQTSLPHSRWRELELEQDWSDLLGQP